MATLAERVRDLAPAINDILRISGAAGASLGILHHGTIHTAGFGFRDVANELAPDENTIYHVASLTKSFTAAGLGILVHDKKLAWDAKVSQVLPDFIHPDNTIRTEATVLDFLTHRTGLASKNSLWQQDGPELLLNHKDLMPTVSYLEVAEPLRSKWMYNNWGYDIASEIIEKISGQSYSSFLAERILTPLGLNNTYTQLAPPEENWAHGYIPGPDGQFTDIGRPVIAGGTIQQGANAIKSTVKDLLTYYKAVLAAWRRDTGSDGDSASSSPLKNIDELLKPHIVIDDGTEHEQWYGAGWALADLPTALGSIGTNGMFLPSMPVVGKGGERKRVWYHNGSLVGFFSSVHIVPADGSIIVVLVNSIPKNDCADWLGQFLLENIVLDVSEKNDYVALATESADAYDKMWKDLQDEFGAAHAKPPPRPLSQYVGRYYNKPQNWFIEVTETNGALRFAFQGRASQAHHLLPHDSDTFIWPISEEESRRRGRWPDLDLDTYLFKFGGEDAERITLLQWLHDPDVPAGETFRKITTPSETRSEL